MLIFFGPLRIHFLMFFELYWQRFCLAFLKFAFEPRTDLFSLIFVGQVDDGCFICRYFAALRDGCWLDIVVIVAWFYERPFGVPDGSFRVKLFLFLLVNGHFCELAVRCCVVFGCG